MQKIISIVGEEPRRDGEFPLAYMVGLHYNKIERREENLGTYGLIWYDVYSDDVLVASLNALNVAFVEYGRPSPEGA